MTFPTRTTFFFALSATISAIPASAQVAPPPRAREAWAVPGKAIDVATIRDTAVASLVRAETAFMQDVARRRIDGWVDGFSDSAATFSPNSPVAVGRDAIRRRMTATFADTSVHVAWHPTYATVAASGELGYTYGYYRWTSRTATGAPDAPELGKYFTAWRRDEHGRWRVSADIGNAGPVPPGFFARDSAK